MGLWLPLHALPAGPPPYLQHIFNFVLIYAETMLTNMSMLPHMLGLVGLWSVSYGLFAMLYFQLTATWTYPFLRTDRWWTPLAYLGLLLGHWLFFGAAYAIVQLRDAVMRRYLGTAPSTPSKARAARAMHTPSKQELAHTPSKARAARALHTPSKGIVTTNGSAPATPVRASARLAAKTKSVSQAS